MATVTMASINNVLKEIYEKQMHDQIESEVKTAQRIERSSEGITHEVGGKYVTFPIRYARNHGIGARGENELLPAARQNQYAAARVQLTYLYGSVELTGQTIRLAESNSQAFVSVLDQEMRGLKESLAKDMNRQLYGTNIGKLGTANAAGSTTTFLCSNAEGIYFEIGMIVDLYDNADALKAGGSGLEITNVEMDTPSAGTTRVTFTPAATGATASGDYFTRDDSRAKEIIGFREIVSPTGTLYNINPATVPVWKSVSDSAGGALAEGRMIKMIDDIYTNGGKTTVIFTSLGVRRSYFNLLEQLRQVVNTRKFEGGFTGLAFSTDMGDIPLMSDLDCPWNTLFFLNEKEIKIYRDKDWSWMDMDGSIWQRKITGASGAGNYDAYGSMMYQYCNMGTHRRNSHGIMTGITEAA